MKRADERTRTSRAADDASVKWQARPLSAGLLVGEVAGLAYAAEPRTGRVVLVWREASAVLSLSAVLVLATGVGAAAADTAVFSSTGVEQTFTVPAGVSSVQVVATGGRGGVTAPTGPSSAISGGAPARVSGVLAVTPGQVLYVEVGGDGAAGRDGSSPASFNGGGAGGRYAGAGGGASSVASASRFASLAPDPRLVIAAGGGGGAVALNSAGGIGGGPDAAGASTASGATGGRPGGPPAVSSTGGAGGAPDGASGGLGSGGAGGSTPSAFYGGGGGGGGFTGGGGGGSGSAGSGGGGGGGGSSLAAPSGTITKALDDAVPQVVLTYTVVSSLLPPPPSPALPAPAPRVPSCTLQAPSSRVVARRRARGAAIAVLVRCDQTATVRLGGRITIVASPTATRRTPRRTSLALSTISRGVVAGTTTSATLTVPALAVRRMRAGSKATLALILTLDPAPPVRLAIALKR